MKQLILCAALALTFPAAQAVNLVPGKSVALGGTTALSQPWLAGQVLDSMTSLFSYGSKWGTPGANGSVQSMVVRSAQTGTLDFYWEVTNSAGSLGSVGNLRIGNFNADSFDANFRNDIGGDQAPTSAYKSSSYPSFNFQFFKPDDLYNPSSTNGLLGIGKTSAWLFMHTDATHYDKLAFMDVANGASTSASAVMFTFGPSAVPEPGTCALLSLGLLAIGTLRQRRRAQAGG